MKKILFTLTILLVFNFQFFGQINYTITKKVNQTDTIFKHILKDPYRWLENTKSPEVINWFKEQQKFTDATLNNLNGVDTFINQLNDYNKQKTWYRNPRIKVGNTYYYTKSGRNQLNETIYYKAENDTTEHFLLDTWKIHKNKRYRLDTFEASPNNKYLAVALDEKGEEYPFVKVYDVTEKKWLSDSIPHVYGINWNATSKGFIYGMNISDDRFDPANNDKEVYKYHQINTIYSDDIIVMDNALREKVEPIISNSFTANLFSADSKTRIYFQPNLGFENEYSNVYYAETDDLSNTSIKWKKLFSKTDFVHTFNYAKSFVETETGYYFISSIGKGFKSLRKTGFNNPDFTNAKIILPEDEIWQLETLQNTKSYIIATYSKYGFIDKVVFIDKKTDKKVSLKSLKSLQRYNVTPFGNETDECWLNIMDVNRPRRSFVLNVKKDILINDAFWAVQNQTLLAGYENVISEIIEVPSYDGSLVPMTIMKDKNTILDGNNICFMYGYGAYGIGTKDNFYNVYDPVFNLLLQRGVILVHAYVRGGGEKGESWHEAGMKLNKPNTWKDFIACAEYLIKNKYTQSSKLACTGASAGGVLIGRAIEERPELFTVAHIQSGSLNLTRANAFANGIRNFGEYGDPNIESEFNGLVAMDATLQSKPNTKYPAIYITTGINDTRVSPWVSAKFIATMQANSISNKPVLLHTNFEGGHFGDANAESFLSLMKTQLMSEFFMLWQCGHKDFQKK